MSATTTSRPAADELPALFAEVGRAAEDHGQLDEALRRLAESVDPDALAGALCRLPVPDSGRCAACGRVWPARRLAWTLRSAPGGGHKPGGLGCGAYLVAALAFTLLALVVVGVWL